MKPTLLIMAAGMGSRYGQRTDRLPEDDSGPERDGRTAEGDAGGHAPDRQEHPVRREPDRDGPG